MAIITINPLAVLLRFLPYQFSFNPFFKRSPQNEVFSFIPVCSEKVNLSFILDIVDV